MARRREQPAPQPRAWGYTRVSTSEQESSGLGLDEQQTKITARCLENGWRLERVYTDTISGSIALADRPAGMRLLDVVRPHDIVIAAKLDRMFRSARDCLNILEDFKRRRIALWLLDIGECTNANGISELIVKIMSAIWERNRISERIKDSKTAARRQGKHLGGTRQFGYDVADGKLVPNAREQQAITRMRRLRRHGKSLMAIRDAVRKSGVNISHETVRLVLLRPEPEAARASVKWPPGVVDQTSERASETLTIIGMPRPEVAP